MTLSSRSTTDTSAPQEPVSSAKETGQAITVDPKEVGRIARAAFVGTALEWYDFFLFGTASALVFNHLIFAGVDGGTATLAAFATFGVGFLARPLGAIIFGQIGDRLGRRPALIISITMIGIATGVIGILPTYGTIGMWAPILLTILRLLQGIAVGGEWGGATTMAIEHAPPEKRGRYAALVQIGSPVGTLLSSGAFALVLMLPESSVDSWGWRIPFLLTFPFLGIALWIRMNVEESPVFKALEAAADGSDDSVSGRNSGSVAKKDAQAGPLKELITGYWPQLLMAIAASLLGIGGFFVMSTYVLSYATEALHFERQTVVNATLLGAVCQIFVNLYFGRLGEKLGPGRIIGWGGIATAVISYPIWAMIDSGSAIALTAGVCIGVSAVTVTYSVSGLLLSELFPAKMRYSGIAIGANVSGAISGCLPFLATALNTMSDSDQPSSVPGVLILALVALITAAGGFLGERHRVKDDVVVQD